MAAARPIMGRILKIGNSAEAQNPQSSFNDSRDPHIQDSAETQSDLNSPQDVQCPTGFTRPAQQLYTLDSGLFPPSNSFPRASMSPNTSKEERVTNPCSPAEQEESQSLKSLAHSVSSSDSATSNSVSLSRLHHQIIYVNPTALCYIKS